MSFYFDRAGWTDDEIAAGVHIMAELGYFAGDKYDEEYSAHRSGQEFDGDWTVSFDNAGADLIISSAGSTSEIRRRLSQYILEGEKDELITRYTRRERLPIEFRAAAIRSDALPILLKAFLRKVLKTYPSAQVNQEVLELSSAARRNPDKKTVYERVGGIQAYMHRKADEVRLAGHLSLPAAAMRHLLSSCRLHIGLQDMFAESGDYWSTVWDIEVERSRRESASPGAGFIPIDKKRIRYWRVPQMKPLTHFAGRRARAILEALARVPLDEPLASYRVRALEALDEKEPALPPKPQRPTPKLHEPKDYPPDDITF